MRIDSGPKPQKGLEESTSLDKLFKTAFELFFSDLLELVHPQIARGLDLDQVRFGAEKLFADLRKRGHVEPDLVAAVKSRAGERQIILVHIEIERDFRNAFDLRMWRYYMHLRLHSKKPVVPIVVSLHGGPSGAEWRERVDRVGPFEIARFNFLSFGLSRNQVADYIKRPQPLAAALAALMRPGMWDKVEHKLRCLGAISAAKELDVDRQFILGKVVETSIKLSEEEEQRSGPS